MASSPTTVLKQLIRTVAKADQPDVSDRELLRRFATEKDQAAFAVLVGRHTNMVLGVCRRLLPTVQDAEDACQATFLLLTQKAGSVRWQPSVANWLFATARRVARNARVVARRRQRREARAAVPDVVQPMDRITGRELLAALDEALDNLPAAYREPLVLCYLEGLTRDQAAARLGVPLATLHTRIDRGRKRLHTALTKAGCAPGAGLLALAVTSPAGASPPRLVESILTAVTGSPPAAVRELAKGVAVNGVFNKVALALAAVVVVALGAGFGLLGSTAASQPPVVPVPAPAGEENAKDQPKDKPKDAAAKEATISGRVLGPDGRPVPGATLYLTQAVGHLRQPSLSLESTTSGPDGRFEFMVPKQKWGDQATVVAAAAANHGVGWVEVREDGRKDDLTLRLVPDDGPVTGRVVDLEGKPVAGATLRVVQINAAPGEDLGPWLEAAKGRKGWSYRLELLYLPRFTVAPAPEVTTDTEGRFRLTGLGRNRLVTARLNGPAIASQYLRILTRPGPPISVTEYTSPREGTSVVTYYGADFRHVAAPTKPVVGVVCDKDTRQPLAGVTIECCKRANDPLPRGGGIVPATTDAQGRYRLMGMPPGAGNEIMVVPPVDLPYLAVEADVPDSPGLGPVTIDVELKRGVWIEGRITDKVTGQPVPAQVMYSPLDANPNQRDSPGFVSGFVRASAGKKDGSYRIVGMPGPGQVAVIYDKVPYLRAGERDDEDGMAGRGDHRARARIDSARGAESVRRDVTLDPGWTFTGTVLGPDGQPLAGVQTYGLGPTGWGWSDPEWMKTAEFTVTAFNPRRPRDVLFHHAGKGLVGAVPLPKENGGSGTVRMGPGATVTGRLVGADGEPRARENLSLQFRPKGGRGVPDWDWYPPGRITTDREGRFRIAALLPGSEFGLVTDEGEWHFLDALRPGQTKDLGDVPMKEKDE